MKSILTIFTIVAATLFGPTSAQADVAVSVSIAPPLLPVYVQPPIPGDGYMWAPGYWAWDPIDGDYYWVPGTWVLAPFIGALWTPGYWGWYRGIYIWHGGYWGTSVGYYGGIDYGFGYVGIGYVGGYWRNGAFSYNRVVNNIGSAPIAHAYSTSARSAPISRVSFNGGKGGTHVQPTNSEARIAEQSHQGPTAMQVKHEKEAHATPALHASANHGKPNIGATSTPAAFNAPTVAARTPKTEAADRSRAGNAERQQATPQPRTESHQRTNEQASPPSRHEVARQRPNEQVMPAPHREAAHQRPEEQAMPTQRMERAVPPMNIPQQARAPQQRENARGRGHANEEDHREK